MGWRVLTKEEMQTPGVVPYILPPCDLRGFPPDEAAALRAGKVIYSSCLPGPVMMANRLPRYRPKEGA